jgi:D-xylose transport system substrate-binding protein
LAAIALLKGEDLSGQTGGLTLNNGTNDIPFVALTPIGVTKDNVGDTVIADGFRTWEEIDLTGFDFMWGRLKLGVPIIILQSLSHRGGKDG